MNLKVHIILVILLNFTLVNESTSQSVQCEYLNINAPSVKPIINKLIHYHCLLITKNDNFNIKPTEITGKHIQGKQDADVEIISPYQNDLLKILTSIFCDKFENLKEMRFDSMQIESIDEDALQNCKLLAKLYIRFNNIAELPVNLLIQNKNLKLAWMNDNQLTTLPENIFRNQKELEELSLNKNPIEFLPLNIFKALVKLKDLSLYKTNLQDLDPEWFANLRSLQNLHISDNKLTELSSRMFSPLFSLEELDLSDNNIKILSTESFDGLQNLKKLVLYNCSIAELPRGIFSQLINLKSLNLRYNKLTTIHSDSFPINVFITDIFLGQNKINSFDEKFNDNINFLSIYMEDNYCANDYIIYKDEAKAKLSNCFKNYQPRHQNQVREGSCGKTITGQGNIIGGSFISRGSFPWIAALVYDHNGKYFCGGTLVSDQKVVTAAHCIQDKDSRTKLSPTDLKVLLGMHNLKELFEVGRRSLAVHNIHVHSAWNPKSERFDADIAVVVLDEVITFGRTIQPICMIESTSAVLSINIGVVVGYGKSEDESKIHEETPKIIDVPIHSNEECFITFSDLTKISSRRTFCGGHAIGTGVCKGDSGSGLVVNHYGAYYLRGIVSASIFKFGKSCDVDKYSIFTDVLKFINWINGIDVEDVYMTS